MKLTFLFPLLGLISGIYLGSELLPGYGFPLICLGLSIAIWLIIHIISRNPVKASKFKRYHIVWILFLFAFLGSWNYEFNFRMKTEEDITEKQLYYIGEIEEIQNLTSSDRIKVKIKKISNNTGKEIGFKNLGILLQTDGYLGKSGDIINFKGEVLPFRSDSKRWKNYAERMKREGIYYKINLKGEEIRKTGETNSISNIFEKYREDLIIKIEKSRLSGSTSNFIISLLLGEKTFLSSETKETLSAAGMAHILAVSGLHVGIILSILLILFFPLSLTGHQKAGKIISICLIWIYVLLTGCAPSTIRAAIMVSMMVMAFVLQRKNSSMNSLLAAAFIILLLSPGALWNIGFQLSFIAVASILIFTEKLNPVDRHSHHRMFAFISLIIITIVTTFSTWVLMAYYFKNVPLLFLPANIILLPTLPFFVGGAMLYIILLGVGLDSTLLSNSFDFYYEKFMNLAGLLSSNSQSVLKINVDEFSVLLWLTAVLTIGIMLYLKTKRQKQILIFISIFCFGSSMIAMAGEETDAERVIKFNHNFSAIEATLYNSNETRNLSFPRNSVSTSLNNEWQILAVDCIIKDSEIKNLFAERGIKKYLIIGPGADHDQIAEIINANEIEKIILHVTVGKKQAANLTDKIEESLRDKIYSLGEKGSLEVFL